MCRWKNYENRSIFSKDMDKSIVSPFFWLTVYVSVCLSVCLSLCTCRSHNIRSRLFSSCLSTASPFRSLSINSRMPLIVLDWTMLLVMMWMRNNSSPRSLNTATIANNNNVSTETTTTVGGGSGGRSNAILSVWLASLSSTSSYSEILQSTTTLSAGDNDQLAIQGIQYHGTSCLELSVFSYKKFRYHRYFQGTSENWTVLCCIPHGLTFLLLPAPPIQTLNIRHRL